MNRFVKIGLIIVVSLLGTVIAAYFAWVGFHTETGAPEASLNIGQTETHSGLLSSSTSSSSDAATFTSRRVLLIADNPHPLSRRIGTLLAQQLTNCPQIEQLELITPPELPAEGVEAPDLFLRLDLKELKQAGILSSSMKATVTAFLGDAPWESSHYSQDADTPPLVNFAWNATLESETTFTGIRTDRYAATAQNVADEFAKAIRKQIEELSTKFPPLPELPRDFYGPYQPVAEFDFLKAAKARRVFSYCGLLTHNQTFWQFQTATNPVPQLQQIINQLQTAGWKISDTSLTNTEDYVVRGRHEDEELEIFRPSAYRMNLTFPEKPEADLEFIVHYRKPFSRAEREGALEKLLVGQCPIETLLPLQNSFSPAQRERFHALVEKFPAASPRACVQIAEIYLQRLQTNAALNMLLCAKALAVTLNDASTLTASIESLAKKISPQSPLKLEVTPEICRQLGFLEITNATPTLERECALGQPLLIFGPGQHGLEIFSLTIRPPQKSVYPWTQTMSHEGSHSTASSSFTLAGEGNWRQTFSFNQLTLKITTLPLTDLKRVRFTLQAER